MMGVFIVLIQLRIYLTHFFGKNMLFDNYIVNLSEKIEKKFQDIKVVYNFDNGPEFEVALCKILRSFLPNKFGICRGFAVSSDGTTKGDDIIIFDQERFPTLRLLPKEDYSIKEQIPIEAIYAYIEAKHTLTEESFAKSVKQIIEVKKLCARREKVGIYQNDPYIAASLKTPYATDHLPNYRNPVFTMIFSRFAKNAKSSKSDAATNAIDSFLRQQLSELTKEDFEFFPELIVAGNSNFLSTSFKREEENKPTIFHLADRPSSGYQVIEQTNLAFGISFAHLMAAIDWIRLGKMPWEEIINESKTYQSSTINCLPEIVTNKPLEINFSPEDFIDGCFKVQHNLGYTPQISVLTENGEEIMTDVKKTQNEAEINVSLHCVQQMKGRVIIY